MKTVALSDSDWSATFALTPDAEAASLGAEARVDSILVRPITSGEERCFVQWTSELSRETTAASLRDAGTVLQGYLAEIAGTLALDPSFAPRHLAEDAYSELRTLVWPVGATARDLAKTQSVWYKQGFTFSDDPGARVGFFQPANGPCGVLAATLAEMMAEACFRGRTTDEPVNPDTAFLNLGDSDRKGLLARAMATMLDRAAQGRMAEVPPAMAASMADTGAGGSGTQERQITVVLPVSLSALMVPEAAEEKTEVDPDVAAIAAAAGIDVSEAMAAMGGVGGAARPTPPAFKRAESSFEDPFVDAGGSPKMRTVTLTSKASAAEFLREHINYFVDGPGPLLLLYSLVLTRGIDRIREDMSDEVSVTSLIYENACSEQCVVNLMLTGVARYNIGDETWPGWEQQVDVGFLTIEDSYTVGQCFLNPALPVWVVLGGGHYTTIWGIDKALAKKENLPPLAESARDAEVAAALSGGGGVEPRVPCVKGCGFYGTKSSRSMCSKCFKESGLSRLPIEVPAAPAAATSGGSSGKESEDEIFHVYHFNGLHPPNAPAGAKVRLARIRATVYGNWAAKGVQGVPGLGRQASMSGEEEAVRDAVNLARKIKKVLESKEEADGIKFCVACDKDGSMETGSLPTHRWRCRDCHLQSMTVWTAINDATSTVCRECGKHVSECGFCHWVSEQEMPKAKRDEYFRARAPAILKMLRAKFPRVDVDAEGQAMPALWG